MAIIDVPRYVLPPMGPFVLGSITYNTHAMTGSAHKVAMVVEIEEAGVLDWFEFRTSTVGNNPDNGLRLSFQNLASDGTPDGVQDQFVDITGTINSDTWQVPSGIMTDDGTGGGVPRTVARGDRIACVVEFVSFVASDSVQVSSLSIATSTTRLNQYVVHFTTAWSAAQGSLPAVALKYSDGSYRTVSGGTPSLPASALTTTTFNTGSTDDEIAMRFQLPISKRVSGAWVRVDSDATYDVVLYNSVSGVLQTKTVASTHRASTGAGWALATFDTPQELSANTTYRLSVKPTSGSNISVYDYSVASAARLDATEMGAEWYLSTRADAGAWSDVDTRVPFISLVIDGEDDGDGGLSPSGGPGQYLVAPRLIGRGGLL
jgi:hypothetical protein